MPETAAASHAAVTTTKAVLLRHLKDGTHVILSETAPINDDAPRAEARNYDLGAFNAITAKTLQSHLQFRYASPGSLLTEEEVGRLRAEVRTSSLFRAPDTKTP